MGGSNIPVRFLSIGAAVGLLISAALSPLDAHADDGVLTETPLVAWDDRLDPTPNTMSVVRPDQLTFGDIFVGLALQDDEPGDIDLAQLHIGPIPPLPDQTAGQQPLCVSIVSVDGRYEGSVVYATGGNVGGLSERPQQSEHQEELQYLFSAANLRMFSTLDEDCNAVSGGVLIASSLTDTPEYLVATIGILNAMVNLRLVSQGNADGAPIEHDSCRRSWAVDGAQDCFFDLANVAPGPYSLEIDIQFAGRAPISHAVLTRLP